MSKARLLGLALVAAGLAPGTWLRSSAPPFDGRQILTVTALRVAPRQLGPLRLLGAWQLASPNSRFGGYSALVALPGGRLLAGSDRGGMLIFTPPGGNSAAFEIARFGRFNGGADRLYDLEALTRDPGSGRLWAAYEAVNRILRLEGSFAHPVSTAPPAMRGWAGDSGPEAMTRLHDGRFIVLAERTPRWFGRTSPGLVFAGDPLALPNVWAFDFARPHGFSPTDMAQLPDGSIIIMLRSFRLGMPPRFPGKIAIADPASLRPGGVWHARVIGDLAAPLPSDNYEAVAVQPRADGTATVWIMSDDNRSPFQRTLLLKFRWAQKQKGARTGRTPLAK